MSLSITVVEHIPERVGRRGPRASIARDIYDAVQNADTHRIVVTAGDKQEAEAVYKQLIQFRHRHDEIRETFCVQKDGLKIYAWKPAPEPVLRARQPRQLRRRLR